MRYEYQTVPYSERLQTENAISNVPGLITFGEPQPQKNAIMPRIGIAYSPGTSGKTSIRAGFGMFYDVLYDNQGLLTLPPQVNHTVDVTGLGILQKAASWPTAAFRLTPPVRRLRKPTLALVLVATCRTRPGPRPAPGILASSTYSIEDYTFESRYVGTHSVHLSVQDQLNRQSVVNASNALPLYLTAPSQAALNGLTNTLAASDNRLQCPWQYRSRLL